MSAVLPWIREGDGGLREDATGQKAEPLRIGGSLDSPDAKRSLNRRMFTVIAAEYRWVTAALSFGRDAGWKRQLVGALPRMSSPICLDLACGHGDLTRRLARRYPAGSVLGLDLTPAMIVQARRLTREPNVCYVEADMAATGLPSASVDIVTGGYALRNAPDLDDAVREIARVLRPGGHAAFLDFMRRPDRAAGRAQIALLRAWGTFWGLLLHWNADVYAYIAESLRRFPPPDELIRRFAARGLRCRRMHSHFFGFTTVMWFRKEIGGAVSWTHGTGPGRLDSIPPRVWTA